MNQIYAVPAILDVLEPRPTIGPGIVTREAVVASMEHNPKAIFPVVEECLEGAQVLNGGCVCVDFTRRPAPPRHKSKGGDGSSDLCMCWAVFPGQKRPAVMLKDYWGVWGPWQMVSTRYDLAKHPYDLGMAAKEIFGVVIASWGPEGRLLWKRDPESFPAELGTVPTIHGDNVGDPIPMKDVLSKNGSIEDRRPPVRADVISTAHNKSARPTA